MKRQYIAQLLEWKNKGSRRPLILEGARGVGKTWLLHELGRIGFAQTLYVDIESDNGACNIFRSISNSKQLIATLENTYNTKIDNETLIILDEAQCAPDIFYRIQPLTEELPWLRIAVACSLSGIALMNDACAAYRRYSYPGNATHITVYPLTFHEFLMVIGHDKYLENAIPDTESKSNDILKQDMCTYMHVGGMPQCVSMYVNKAPIKEIHKCHLDILSKYNSDFSVHSHSDEIAHLLQRLWTSIIQGAYSNNALLTCDSKYIHSGKNIIDILFAWLQDAFLISTIYTVNDVRKKPLTGYSDINNFKAYPLDIGLMSAILDSEYKSHSIQQEIYTLLSEQFIAQELIAASGIDLRIFTWSTSSNTHNVDFVVDVSGKDVIPIEVVHTEGKQSPGFSEYLRRYNPKHAILATTARTDLTENSQVKRIPLYAVSSYLRKLTTH